MHVHDNTQTHFMGEVTRQDGKIFRYCKAHGTLTAKTPYKILADSSGWLTAAIADAASNTVGCAYGLSGCKIGIPEAAVASGTYGWLQVGGKVSDAILTSCTATVNYCVGWVAATCIKTGAAFSGQREVFAIFTATGATATTQDILMLNREVGCDST